MGTDKKPVAVVVHRTAKHLCGCAGHKDEHGDGDVCSTWGFDPRPWCYVHPTCPGSVKVPGSAFSFKHCSAKLAAVEEQVQDTEKQTALLADVRKDKAGMKGLPAFDMKRYALNNKLKRDVRGMAHAARCSCWVLWMHCALLCTATTMSALEVVPCYTATSLARSHLNFCPLVSSVTACTCGDA
jgi:hypothetical protein